MMRLEERGGVAIAFMGVAVVAMLLIHNMGAHRSPKGYEAIGEDNASHGCFPSQKEAAAALQQVALHDCIGCGDL
jgi:hypothetical protein